ncbi:MAG: TonB-dependent receptor plug domain-containing protein, partial [Flavobacteriales bacterium]
LPLLPGVQKGSEGSSGFYVRGGGPDQNLIILDDATVYNANHLFGFFSIFNGDALKSVELTKGGFPARYGGRLSSVLEMRMRDGSKKEIKGEAGIGLISSRLTLEGPIQKNKSSFLISARRTYIDALIYPFLPADQKAGYFFYDGNAKLNFILNTKNRLYVSAYSGKDKFYFRPRYSNGDGENGSFQWQNITSTVRLNHIISDKAFSNTSFIFSRYKLGIGLETVGTEEPNYSLTYNSGIRDWSFKHDVDYFPNTRHHIRLGLMSTAHRFTPSAFVVESSDALERVSQEEHYDGVESGLYAEDDWDLSETIRMNVGFRLSNFTVSKRTYFGGEPRFSMRWKTASNQSIKASYAWMNQYMHLLSNTGVGLPTDLWVPATDRVKPQRSHQVALGYAIDLEDPTLTITVEGYYKRMLNMIGYREGASFLNVGFDESGNISWQDNVTSGSGQSYGAEFLLQRKEGKMTGWIGYTLSWTTLTFPELNNGKTFFARYDRRHDLSVVLMYEMSERFTISATWVYGTGQAITLPLATYAGIVHSPNPMNLDTFGYYSVSDYGEKNSFRMAPYHRLDIAARWTKPVFSGKAMRTFELGVYNAYNRKNPFFYNIDTRSDGTSYLAQVSLFPILPSVSWNVAF